MTDIVLVHPTYSEHEFALDETRSPMALLTISAKLHEEGYKIRIINQQINPNWEKDLKLELKNKPICVGVTSLTGFQIFYALKAAKVVKENSDVPLIWGGIHASMLPEQTVKNQYVNIVVYGEGEETFYELVHALETKRNSEILSDIKGICWKKNGEITRNPPRPLLQLESLPLIPFELDELFFKKKNPEITIITSRGCPSRCGFCYSTFYHKRVWRSLKAQKVIEDILQYENKYGKDSKYGKSIKISFGVESNFFVKRKRVEEICEGLEREKIDVSWDGVSCRAEYVSHISHRTLDLIKNLGCERFAVGAESGSQRILDLIRKDIKVQDIIDAGKKVSEHGMNFYTGWMMGMPYETPDDRDETVAVIGNLIEMLGKKMLFGVYNYIPFPNTETFKMATELGFHPPQRLQDWAMLDVRFSHSPWLTEEDKEKIEQIRNLSLVAGVHPVKGLAGLVSNNLGRWGKFRFKKKLFGRTPELTLQVTLNDLHSLVTRGKRRKYQIFHHDVSSTEVLDDLE